MANLNLNRLSKTRREQLIRDTNESINHLMLGISAQPMVLVYTVASGPEMFRQQFLREYRGFLVDRNIADNVFRFFCEQVVRRWGTTPPKVILTDLEKAHKSPPTQEEIDRAWRVDIASSEDGMARFYEGGARTRTGADLGVKKIIH